MKSALRFRFWLEIGMSSISCILFIITLIWRDWIEIVFGVSPDNGNGSAEWLIIGVLFVVTVTLFSLARYEWRRSAATT